MKKFIIKTSLFVIPFLFLYLTNVLFCEYDQGDLVRLGYLYSNSSPKEQISKQYSLSKKYTLLSELNFDI